MIEIKFKINGREVAPDKLKDAMSAAVLQSIKKQVQQKLGRVRCPEHGQPPRVTAHGSSLDRLSFSVEGCCQKLIDEATRALK